MSQAKYMSAAAAAQLLGVQVATIYAYVSRGLIRSEPAGHATKRTRRYLSSDVLALRERKVQRRQPDRVAEQALHYGAPVLDSAISLIRDGMLYYRGEAVEDLCQRYQFEQVADLLWQAPRKRLGRWASPHFAT